MKHKVTEATRGTFQRVNILIMSENTEKKYGFRPTLYIMNKSEHVLGTL